MVILIILSYNYEFSFIKNFNMFTHEFVKITVITYLEEKKNGFKLVTIFLVSGFKVIRTKIPNKEVFIHSLSWTHNLVN